MSKRSDILLINRDADFLEAMTGFLRKAGLTVHTAMDMRTALSRLSRNSIDLIISDNVLKDVSGYDFLRFVKNDPLRDSIPFVFFVPINDQGRAFKAFELGAVDFLVYPMEVDDFVERIQEILVSCEPEAAGTVEEDGTAAKKPETGGEIIAPALKEEEPPTSEEPEPTAEEARPVSAIRIDLSRDGLFWMPGQIRNFSDRGILVVTALLGKPGVMLHVKFPFLEERVTIKGQIMHVVFDDVDKPVGIDIAFEKSREWARVHECLNASMEGEESPPAVGAAPGRQRRRTTEITAETTGTLLIPHGQDGLEDALLLHISTGIEDSFEERFYRSLIGRQLDNYRAVSFIGSGTMGGVFKGWDAALERVVALKVISYQLSAQEAFRDMFIKEARLISKLDHQNIAHIYAIGSTNDILYFAMEFIDGDTLADLITEHHNLYTLRGLDYLITVCETLDFVRLQNIIHRDIKPENIIINDKGILKIVDFGVAKRVDVHASGASPDGIVGSPLYMSPDSITQDVVDHRSDIYSLGATFYHVFTGEPPFIGNGTKEILLNHIKSKLIPLSDRNPKISPALSRIIEKMMAKDPDRRYQNYQEIIKDLKIFRSRVIQAKKQGSCTFRPQVRG